MKRNNPGGWEILTEHLYEQFKIFSAKRSTRVNPRTGKPFDFFLMEGCDWVNLIPVTPRETVVFVRQYRHGSEEFTLETPGGTVEPNEEPMATARRELTEETGYSAKEIAHLGTLQPNPAMQKMRIHYYVARGVERTHPQALDPGEDIEVIERPLIEVPQMIQSGELTSALVVAAFGLLRLR
ncbi:MAG: NUDIX hydrolase [Proteobacteria bacterium]|nr:NUDIX hydrolase [Pseudomonadota bacterium]